MFHLIAVVFEGRDGAHFRWVAIPVVDAQAEAVAHSEVVDVEIDGVVLDAVVCLSLTFWNLTDVRYERTRDVELPSSP